jgi:uncharacterized protein (DUF1501 family)
MTDSHDEEPGTFPTPDGTPAEFEHDWTDIHRRDFLKLIGGGAALAAGAAAGLGNIINSASPAAAATTRPRLAQTKKAAGVSGASAPRVLVALDCAGGLDGASMLFPYAGSNFGPYLDQRPEAHIDGTGAIHLNSEVAVHPNLAQSQARGMAWVQGVGIANYDLSHFESLRRWWAGDMVDGSTPLPGGFLGRVCDAVGDPGAAAVGVTIGFGPTAAFAGAGVATVPCNPYGPFALPIPSVNGSFDTAFHNALAAASVANPGDSAMAAAARKGSSDLLGFLDLLQNLSPGASGYPNTTLGKQLQLAARIIRENAGVRVIHVPVFGDFDTHRNHVSRHVANMTKIDNALSRFLDDLETLGLKSSTLVMQYSEFGRRGFDNNSAGLDHGDASMLFMTGAVNPGVYGAYPAFDALDAQGNLTPSVLMTEYYAVAAESWFGVPANSVLTGNPTPVAGIV